MDRINEIHETTTINLKFRIDTYTELNQQTLVMFDHNNVEIPCLDKVETTIWDFYDKHPEIDGEMIELSIADNGNVIVKHDDNGFPYRIIGNIKSGQIIKQ